MCHQAAAHLLRPTAAANYLQITHDAQRTNTFDTLPTRETFNTPSFQLAAIEAESRQRAVYIRHAQESARAYAAREALEQSTRREAAVLAVIEQENYDLLGRAIVGSQTEDVERLFESVSERYGREGNTVEEEGLLVGALNVIGDLALIRRAHDALIDEEEIIESNAQLLFTPSEFSSSLPGSMEPLNLSSSAAEAQPGEGANDIQVLSMRFDPHAPFSTGSDLLSELIAQWDRNSISSTAIIASIPVVSASSSRAPFPTLPLSIQQQRDLPSPSASEDDTSSDPITRLLSNHSQNEAQSQLRSSIATQLPQSSRFDIRALPQIVSEAALPTPPPTPEEEEENYFPTVDEARIMQPSRRHLPTVDVLINVHEDAWEALLRMPEPRNENGERRLPTVDEVTRDYDRSWNRVMRMPELRAVPPAPLPAQQPSPALGEAWEDVLRMPSPRDENGAPRLPTVDELLADHDRSWGRLIRVSRSESHGTSMTSRQAHVDSSETDTEDEAEDVPRPPAPYRPRYEGTDSPVTDSNEESVYPRTKDLEEGYLSDDTLVEDENITRSVYHRIRVQRRLNLQVLKLARSLGIFCG